MIIPYVGLFGPNFNTRSSAVGLIPDLENKNESNHNNTSSGSIKDISLGDPICTSSATLPFFITGAKVAYFLLLLLHTWLQDLVLALKDCSYNESVQEKAELQLKTKKQDSTWLNSTSDPCGYGNRLIQRQDEIIKALTEQISYEEQELLERDIEITKLEDELEVILAC